MPELIAPEAFNERFTIYLNAAGEPGPAQAMAIAAEEGRDDALVPRGPRERKIEAIAVKSEKYQERTLPSTDDKLGKKRLGRLRQAASELETKRTEDVYEAIRKDPTGPEAKALENAAHEYERAWRLVFRTPNLRNDPVVVAGAHSRRTLVGPDAFRKLRDEKDIGHLKGDRADGPDGFVDRFFMQKAVPLLDAGRSQTQVRNAIGRRALKLLFIGNEGCFGPGVALQKATRTKQAFHKHLARLGWRRRK